MAALPASVPSWFPIPRKAGVFAPVEPPENPANSFAKICENPSKTHPRQPSSTLVNPKKLLAPAPPPGLPPNNDGAVELRGRHGARLCPARRRISRSASSPQAMLSISDAVMPAKLLRLVCDPAAIRARSVMECGGKRHAAFVRATVLKRSRPARACESAVAAALCRRRPRHKQNCGARRNHPPRPRLADRPQLEKFANSLIR